MNIMRNNINTMKWKFWGNSLISILFNYISPLNFIHHVNNTMRMCYIHIRPWLRSSAIDHINKKNPNASVCEENQAAEQSGRMTLNPDAVCWKTRWLVRLAARPISQILDRRDFQISHFVVRRWMVIFSTNTHAYVIGHMWLLLVWWMLSFKLTNQLKLQIFRFKTVY